MLLKKKGRDWLLGGFSFWYWNWDIGRLFLAPNPRECYIRYHDSTPQVIILKHIGDGNDDDDDEDDDFKNE